MICSDYFKLTWMVSCGYLIYCILFELPSCFGFSGVIFFPVFISASFNHWPFHVKNFYLKNLSQVSVFLRRYEKTWDKPNKTKLLQDALERAGRLDLAERLRCLHWGHQKLSRRVELPSAFPFLITVHKTMRNQDALLKINDLNHRPF